MNDEIFNVLKKKQKEKQNETKQKLKWYDMWAQYNSSDFWNDEMFDIFKIQRLIYHVACVGIAPWFVDK